MLASSAQTKCGQHGDNLSPTCTTLPGFGALPDCGLWQRRRRRRPPGRRVIENKHSTDIGAFLTFQVNTHTDARRWRKIVNVGGVLVNSDPPRLAPPHGLGLLAAVQVLILRVRLRERGQHVVRHGVDVKRRGPPPIRTRRRIVQ